jgi:hypothetical protein
MSIWKGSVVALLVAAVWTFTIVAVDRRDRASPDRETMQAQAAVR